MESLIFLGILAGVCLIAYILGIRDQHIIEKALVAKLKKEFGNAPGRVYKEDDLDHLNGYYRRHQKENQIDDITWNDLNMDGVFARMNYCLSASGEEYLYYLLRTPSTKDDFDDFEKKVDYFQNNDEDRRKLQIIFAKIGRRIRHSIYDYLDYLDNVDGFSNTKHFIMIGLIALAAIGCFINFKIGFVVLVALVVTNIISYFKVKNEIEPYLVTYNYIIKVIYSVQLFEKVKIAAIEPELMGLQESAKKFNSFLRGSSILMSPTRNNSSGNPLDLLVDYIRMALHLDIIKFNQMYKEIMANKEHLDKIITIIGKMETEIAVACYRESVKDHFVIPKFDETVGYEAKGITHPLIEGCIENDVNTKKGLLITGSNASGKSTYLKSCAINAILAQTIHTVLGKEYRAPFFRIFSSMALTDDIFEGDSYYIVEIKSIKRILDAAKKEGAKVLCFVDEVLRGTNTIERIAASTEILKSFAGSNVLCFAATHDIELTSLLSDKFDLCHFEGHVSNNDVHFDYLVKEGPATNRNAISLLGLLGYDENIVDNAQNLANKFLTTGHWD
ncbi:MAG: hypothetical protein II842_14065 [Butyrivibrio sp.]|nr:hypothetical protein [Butyrivibrio sp.]